MAGDQGTGGKEISRVTVRLLGEDYTVSGPDAPEHLSEVAGTVQALLDQLQAANSRLTKTQLAVLAALKLAEDLFRLRLEHREMLDLLKEAR